MKPTPITLTGFHVRLEPLTLGHLDALAEIGLDQDLWRWTTTLIRTRDELRAYIEEALALQARGTALPFATVDLASGRVAGSSRFGNIDVVNRKLEIGWTWVGRPWQRTAVNTEAKYLMFRHAFEDLGCIRVELKTDALNTRSRDAILRVGAKEEGTFRNHMISQGGRLRDSVYFSVIASEWRDVKARLEEMLESGSRFAAGGSRQRDRDR
jgi:N-acetyltransferase